MGYFFVIINNCGKQRHKNTNDTYISSIGSNKEFTIKLNPVRSFSDKITTLWVLSNRKNLVFWVSYSSGLPGDIPGLKLHLVWWGSLQIINSTVNLTTILTVNLTKGRRYECLPDRWLSSQGILGLVFKIRILPSDLLVPGSLIKPNYNFNRTTSICLDQRGNWEVSLPEKLFNTVSVMYVIKTNIVQKLHNVYKVALA